MPEKFRDRRTSPHFKKGKFINPIPTVVMQPGKAWNTLSQWFRDNDKRKPAVKPGPFRADPSAFTASQKGAIRVIWLAHSTVLFTVGNKWFLTDPVWADTVSPFPWAGPRRFFDMPLAIDKLPPLEGVILSHDHYDHLDRKAIGRLAKGDHMFYCPLGLARYLVKWGVNREKIRELDWNEEIFTPGGIQLISAPARHFSGRGLFNRNRTLWTSWIIRNEEQSVFYSGDTGMHPGLEETGNKYGPFDLTVIEAGAYHPNWGSIHLGPENAVKAHRMLKGKILLPVHWGTFRLALHGWTEPAEDIITYAGKNGVSFLLPQPGEYISLPHETVVSGWWRRVPEVNPTG